MRYLFAILTSVLLLGCSPQSSDPPSVAEVAAGYTKLRLMTKKPIYVPPASAMACSSSAQQRVDEERLNHGPHAQTSIEIYMNELAANAFDRATYPVGSVIVKQKYALRYRTPSPDPSAEPVYLSANNGVGGMIKREPGYDPEHGDWEYFYFEVPTEIESGRIDSCVQCHQGAARSDYVFGSWSKPG